MEVNHKVIKPLENDGIFKVMNNTDKSKLREELKTLKERNKGLNSLMKGEF